MAQTNEFRPDYAVPPGWVLEERLDVNGMSHAEFARRCGRSPKLISEIIAGKAPLEPETALQFEKVLGVDASIWLGIETEYQLHRARASEAAFAKAHLNWVKAFPIRELVSCRALPKPVSDEDAVPKLLAFFQVASVDSWNQKYLGAHVAFRHSSTFMSSKEALATWLRLGELNAEKQSRSAYSEVLFKQVLKKVRSLTREPLEQAWPEAQKLCNTAGVALALVEPLPKVAASGAAWWRTAKEPIIELSARHKSDDHLWFSLFHEAAHILLHSKKRVFIDGLESVGVPHEKEADEWASNMLVPQSHWKRFVATSPCREVEIRNFADQEGIAPGIVVGMLQHEKILPWTHLNGLKRRLKAGDLTLGWKR